MSARELTYAVVTPVRNEAANIRRIADALARQERLPVAWVVVDTGSTDETHAIVAELAQSASPGSSRPTLEGAQDLARGGPIARAFELGYSRPRRPARCDRQAGRRHVLRARLLHAPARRVRRRPAARDGERNLPRARGRRVARAARHRLDRLGRLALLSARMPCGRPPARAADGLGRRRRVSRQRARLEDARPSRIFRSITIAGRASGTARSTSRASRRAGRPATSATGSGTWRCERSGMPARSRPRSR